MQDTPAASSTIGRRTIVKGAAWSVPLVSAVAVSPAYAACSGPDLNFASFTAAYVNGSNATTSRPDQLNVSFTIKNTGSQATTGLKVTLTIPANTHDTAPTSPSPASGWTSATGWVGSLAAGWTRTYTAPSQLAATIGSLPFSTQVTFNDTASPFRAWDGNGFTLSAVASLTNPCHVGGSGSAVVAASVVTSLSIADSGNFATRDTNGSSRGTILIRGVQPVVNSGRRTSGPVTLTVSLPALKTSVPTGAPTNIATGWTYVSGPTGSGPYEYKFTYATRSPGAALGGTAAGSQTSAFACDITISPLLANNDTTQVTVSITASAPNATDSNTIQDSSG